MAPEMRKPGSSNRPDDCLAYFAGLLPIAHLNIRRAEGIRQVREGCLAQDCRLAPKSWLVHVIGAANVH